MQDRPDTEAEGEAASKSVTQGFDTLHGQRQRRQPATLVDYTVGDQSVPGGPYEMHGMNNEQSTSQAT